MAGGFFFFLGSSWLLHFFFFLFSPFFPMVMDGQFPSSSPLMKAEQAVCPQSRHDGLDESLTWHLTPPPPTVTYIYGPSSSANRVLCGGTLSIAPSSPAPLALALTATLTFLFFFFVPPAETAESGSHFLRPVRADLRTSSTGERV